CSECQRSFRHRSDLVKHRRTHTGEKPYVCAICGKSFTQSSNCRRHECTHTSDQP
ncbi:ZN394 protein, partial [Todus mexicanus]|nr:ZN394 protein [Todus mexicanus]